MTVGFGEFLKNAFCFAGVADVLLSDPSMKQRAVLFASHNEDSVWDNANSLRAFVQTYSPCRVLSFFVFAFLVHVRAINKFFGVTHVVSLVEKTGVNRDRVAFGQLLGMCDHVSLSLGKAGWKVLQINLIPYSSHTLSQVFKYVPYGPIHEVVPYLVRRAEENSMLLGSPGVQRERKMIDTELWRRLTKSKQ